MIKFIQVEELLSIRNIVLREGKLKPQECIFPTDKLEGAFHLGYFENNELACVASFHPQGYDHYKGLGYQLRGMATVEQHRGKGIGNQLVKYAIDHLRRLEVNYLWCNARKVAVGFYNNLGFEIISDEFEVKGIGPHFVMYINIT